MLEIENTYQSFRLDHLIRDNKNFKKEVLKAYKQFMTGDWGNAPRSQILYNEEAISTGNVSSPITGVYHTTFGNLCILTDCYGKTKLVMEDEF